MNVYKKGKGWDYYLRKSTDKSTMCVVTINIPRRHLYIIDNYFTGKDGTYPSRSEFFRDAAKDKLIECLNLENNVDKKIETLEPNQVKIGNKIHMVIKQLINNPNIYNAEEEISK